MTDFTAPDNPGVVIRFASEANARPAASIASTVAVPITHDWGPIGAEVGAVTVNSFGEFDAIFGNTNTAGRRAVLGAFIGSGVPGQPGAGSVVVYRASVAAARKKALVKMKNTTPADAITFTARYYGDRGERIKIVTEADPTVVANNRVRILFDGLTVEKFSYVKTNIAALAEAVNSLSKYVTATKLIDGIALTASAGTALAEGDDGATLTGTEWTEILSALEFEPFTVLAPAALTAEAIQVSIAAWIAVQADAMRPVEAVLGGPDGETLAQAVTRTEKIRDPHIISLGAGLFHDDFLGEDVNTSEIAPRVAGALAGLSEEKSLTNLKFGGLSLVGEAAIPAEQLKAAKEAGITAFRRTSSADAELKINWGVTTYIDQTKPAMEPRIFGDPRLVRIIDLFIRGMVEWGEENIIGNTVINESTEAAIRAEGRSRINSLRDRGLILPGATEAEEPFFNVFQAADVGAPEDAVPFEFGWRFGKTTNFLIGNGRVR